MNYIHGQRHCVHIPDYTQVAYYRIIDPAHNDALIATRATYEDARNYLEHFPHFASTAVYAYMPKTLT
jgi:hypothetical protein